MSAVPAVTVEVKTAQLNAAMAQYATLARLTPPEALAKQGAKLAFYLRGRLRSLAPEKGRTRAERLAAMQAGEGVKVRPGALEYARKKTVATATDVRTRRDALYMEKTRSGNVKRGGRSFWQIAVDREIGIRESGRGYLSLAGRMRWVQSALISGSTSRVVDRVNREIGRAGLTIAPNSAALTFDYSNPHIVEGLERPRGKAEVAGALESTRADIMVYVARKMAENARKAGLR